MKTPAVNTWRLLVRNQRVSTLLLILNAMVFVSTVIVWAIVAYQIHYKPIIP